MAGLSLGRGFPLERGRILTESVKDKNEKTPVRKRGGFLFSVGYSLVENLRQ